MKKVFVCLGVCLMAIVFSPCVQAHEFGGMSVTRMYHQSEKHLAPRPHHPPRGHVHKHHNVRYYPVRYETKVIYHDNKRHHHHDCDKKGATAAGIAGAAILGVGLGIALGSI